MLTEDRLQERTGVVLSDGTLLRDLIDTNRREISMRVINDAEIHEYELRKIFARGWILVAHECEIPNPGDFVTRYIGADKVIVARGSDRSINILLNACAHRGMEVCRTDRGSSLRLTCPYHGWTYDGKGNLVGAPFAREMYGGWNKSDYGLIRARAETCHGVIFGSFDDNGPSLTEYLGDFKWYMDFNLTDTEFVAAGPISRFQVPANWKVFGEQLAGDGYHTAHFHWSLEEVGVVRPGLGIGANSRFGYHTNVATDNGHCLLSWDNRFMSAAREPQADDPFGQERSFPMQVFPCSAIVGTGINGDGKRATANIGGLVPIAHDQFEFWALPLVNKELVDDSGNYVGIINQFASIMGGLFFANDAQQGPSMQRSARGAVARDRLTLKYNSTHGGPNPPAGWKGPGMVFDGFPKDDNQWAWWCHWFDVMTAE